jgi:nucleotide-binding universal stress UspA family protein
MGYKTILAILQDKDDSERVLACALPLVAEYEAHLIGIHAEAIPVPHATPMGMPDTTFMEAGSEMAKQRAAAIKQVFDRQCRTAGITGEWRSFESFSGDSAVSALESARCADLVIVQQRNPDAPTLVADLEALLFHGGRPVLFVPYAGKCVPPFGKAIVAWNGSPESARAAFDAVPLLKAASQVNVLTVDAQSTSTQDAITSGAEIAAALARHGIKLELDNQATGGGLAPADAIQNMVADMGADLLVSGAYSQSRLKAFFFGGVTRSLLNSMTCATFMSR